MSEQTQMVLKSLKMWDSSYRKNAIEFASAIMNTDFDSLMKLFDKKFEYSPGMITVPLKNNVSFSYQLNVPVFMLQKAQAWDPSKNERGNNLPSLDSEDVRIATDEEIEKFYSELLTKDRSHISNFLNYALQSITITVI